MFAQPPQEAEQDLGAAAAAAAACALALGHLLAALKSAHDVVSVARGHLPTTLQLAQVFSVSGITATALGHLLAAL